MTVPLAGTADAPDVQASPMPAAARPTIKVLCIVISPSIIYGQRGFADALFLECVFIWVAANARRQARPAPRHQPTSCNALPSANSGFAFQLRGSFAFQLRGSKVQRWRNTLPPDHGNVRDTTDST